MNFRSVTKNIRRTIKIVVPYLCIIVLFLGIYKCTDMYFGKSISDEQYEVCKEFIYDIYEQGETSIIDLPSDMYYKESTATVKGGKKIGVNHHLGYARAIFENGKLIIIREYQNAWRIFRNLLISIIILLVFWYIKIYICEKIKLE